MQANLDKPQKVKNILVRHSCPFEIRSSSSYQHPETSYILKYAPKYYKTLTLKATSQIPLVSKVKKIKKLQKFNGYCEKDLPKQLWFDLWGNTRKQIEEAPQICWTNHALNPRQSFWERFNEQKLRYFPNVKRIWLHKRGGLNPICDEDNYLSAKESFVRHIRNLRKLESLKITIRDENLEKVSWLLGKLDGMSRVLRKLEAVGLDFSTNFRNIRELFENKNFFAHLTDLSFVARFDPILAEIPQMCKNLKSVALGPQSGLDDESPEFRNLVTSLQQLTQLKSLVFNWPNEVKNIWSHIKPQASLEHLSLVVGAHHLINAGLSEENKLNEIMENWEELKDLKTLELNLTMQNLEHFDLMRRFVTKVLKKVQKVERLKFHIGGLLPEGRTYELFSVEEVPHLHETLEKFEFGFLFYREGAFVKFDLKVLEAFKNLKSVKIDGNILPVDGNVADLVNLLQRNQREGELPILKLALTS